MINRSDSPKRTVRAFGLALAVALAFAGLAAGSASALSISPSSFNGVGSGNLVAFASVGTNVSTCESSALNWTVSGGSGGAFEAEKLRGCKKPVGGTSVSCTTPGQTAGTIALSKLNASLVYLDAAKTKFGYMLTPATGTTVAEFSCGGFFQYKWTGSVLGQITNPALNVETKSATLSFTASGTSQTYQQVEGAGPNYHLYSSEGGNPPVDLSIATSQNLAAAQAFTFLP